MKITADEATLAALCLSKEGFGTVTEILEMPADLVLDALNFVEFRQTYQETFEEINREENT